MRNQSTSLTLGAAKSAVAQLCAIGVDWALCVGVDNYTMRLGSKETIIVPSHASAFTARNPRNPEADPKAALD